jgi:protoporphyrinogen oxidase
MNISKPPPDRDTRNESLIIIGAGPAGLAAAHEAILLGITPRVIEKSRQVGGISRTETYKDYYFDIGGHRFFTKVKKIDALWRQMMGKDFLSVSRMSRIFYRDRFFAYPLNITSTLLNMGILESARIGLSYLKSQVFPYRKEETFEQWVSNRFGRRLYEAFFKSYTEKVWGISCDEIRADWAAQRIQDLSLLKTLTNALFGNNTTKTLIEEFSYPVYGPGMMWDRFSSAIHAGGGVIRLDCDVTRLNLSGSRIDSVVCRREDGTITEHPADHVISSIPITELTKILSPPAPENVLKAADSLSYRSFIIVMLIIDRPDLFPDQWIYIHSPDVNVGRIQNFKNWSPSMVPDPRKTSIGMEYFCNIGDDTWKMQDDRLVRMAADELSRLGLLNDAAVIDSHVVRQPHAYPVYDKDYAGHLAAIQTYLDDIENLQTIGRNGMHRYNNMDHSMLTGMLAVKNITGEHHDVWKINDEDEYLEEVCDEKEDALPEEMILKTFARMDKTAFATALGTVCGLSIFLATIWLVIKGGRVIGPNLRLLDQYFFCYSVSVKGAFWGFGNGFLWGFVFGGAFAFIRNFAMAFYVIWIRKRSEILSLKVFFDHI